MKVKRYKRVQKYLQFYRTKFNYRPPYQVLIDATFCQQCLVSKVNIQEQLPKYLAEQCRLLTTVCVVQEAQGLSQSLYGAMLIVKQFPIRRCGHEKSPIGASECLRQLICGQQSSGDHYMLATQDLQLTRALRRASGTPCPLIYMKGNAMVMQRPLDSIRLVADRQQVEAGQEVADRELQVVRALKKLHDLGSDDDEDKPKSKRTRKGPKGPNPLSCKKKKRTAPVTGGPKAVASSGQSSSKSVASVDPNSGPKKTKRRRNRAGKHIRQMFDKIVANVGHTAAGTGSSSASNQ